jgi:hypothetical protein
MALIISSILRESGFPAIMIETVDVGWAYAFHEGHSQNFAGHVMSEVFVGNRWMLLDNNGSYVEDYDPWNPFIPLPGPGNDSYFVFAKGKDTWDYAGGVRDASFTHEMLMFFAENVFCFEEMFNTVSYTWRN